MRQRILQGLASYELTDEELVEILDAMGFPRSDAKNVRDYEQDFADMKELIERANPNLGPIVVY